MDYSQAVREKQIRQGKTVEVLFEDPHDFKQSFIVQNNFELRPFLWFHYKKKLPEVVIPTGLCDVCGKLEIEHNA